MKFDSIQHLRWWTLEPGIPDVGELSDGASDNLMSLAAWRRVLASRVPLLHHSLPRATLLRMRRVSTPYEAIPIGIMPGLYPLVDPSFTAWKDHIALAERVWRNSPSSSPPSSLTARSRATPTLGWQDLYGEQEHTGNTKTQAYSLTVFG